MRSRSPLTLSLLGLLLLAMLPVDALGAPGGLFGERKADLASPWRWHSRDRRAAQAKPPATKPSPAVEPAEGRCRSDAECAEGSICENGRCKAVDTALNLLYLYYRSADRTFTEVFGIYWNQRGKRGYRVLFPFYWHYWGPHERSRVFFPFYWRFDDQRARTANVVVPPFQYRRAEGERNYRLWPLVFWTDYGDRGAGLTVLPLFHYARQGTRRSFVLPPLLTGFVSDSAKHKSRGLALGLYYWHTNGSFRSKLLFPFFYARSTPRRAFTWALPLNFYWRRGQDKSLLLLPLLWHSSGPSRSFTLAGPVFHRRLGGDSVTGVFPLLLYRNLDHGRRAQLFSPLFAYERDDAAGVRQWGMLVPPYFRRRDRDREVDTLFPIFWRWHDKVDRSTAWVVPPLMFFDDPEGKSQILFPLFWRFKDTRSGNATSVLFPLFYRHARPDGHSTSVLFPFYYKARPDGWSAGALPLLFAGRDGARRHAVVFPVLWHFADASASTTIFGPAYYRSERQHGWLAGLAPLLFAGDRDGEAHHVLFPLFWHLRSRKNASRTVVAGPFFWSRSKRSSVTGLVPLFAHGHVGDAGFTAVLPPLFYRSIDRKTGEGFTLAGLYYGVHGARRSGFSVLPLLHYRRTQLATGGERRNTVLFPLFYHSAAPGKRLLVTPLGGFRRDDQKGIHQAVLGPLIWSKTRRTSGFAVAPLLFHWRNRAERSSTTVLLPFGVHHVSPKMRALVWFPLFWRFVEKDKRSLVAFPLLWKVRDRQGENANVVFPLYWHLWNKQRSFWLLGPAFSRRTAEGQTAGLAPLALYQKNRRRSYLAALPLIYYRNDFKAHEKLWVGGPLYYRRYRDGYGAGIFPLLFHKRRSDSRYSVLAPIFWHFSNAKAKTSTTFVGPFFYRRKAAHRSFGVAPIFYRGSNKAGESTTALFPLFYHHREIAGSAFYTPLFGFGSSPDQRVFYTVPYFAMETPKQSLRIVAPLFVYHRNRQLGESTLLSLPLYYGNWSARRSFHLLFPLFWRYRRVDASATVAFPVWWDFNDRAKSRTTVVFPLLLRHRDHVKDSTAYLFPPGVWVRSRPKATDAIVFPLFWHYGGQKRSTTVGFPLYWDFKRPGKRSTVLFPLYWSFRRGDETSTVLLNSYYWRNSKLGTYSYHFIPLFSVQRRRPGDLYWDVLTGLFGYQRIGRNRFLKLLWLINVKLDPLDAAPLGATKTARWDL